VHRAAVLLSRRPIRIVRTVRGVVGVLSVAMAIVELPAEGREVTTRWSGKLSRRHS
jgi:hypothetical protein